MFPLTHPTLGRPSHPGLWANLRAHFAHIEKAHARQARRATLTANDARDTGMTPEDVLGEPTYDPALPFFLQSGFGRR